jgi:undecaprenyl-diphosphatase
MIHVVRSRAAKLAIAAACVLLVIAAGSERFLKLDAEIAAWIRAHAIPENTGAALALTTLGSSPLALSFLVLAAIPFAMKRWWADLALLVMCVVGGILTNPRLKDFFDRPRPFSEGQTLTFPGTSFPSGHAMTATLLWGALLMIALPRLSPPRRTPAVVAAVAIVGIVAATRIYLGAHYLTDVLGGVAFGLLWLAICDAIVRAIAKSPRARDKVTS